MNQVIITGSIDSIVVDGKTYYPASGGGGPVDPPPGGGGSSPPGTYPSLGNQGQSSYFAPGVYEGPVFPIDTYVLIQLWNENTNPGMVYVASASAAPDPNVTNYAPWADYSSGSGGGAVGPHTDPKVGAVKIIPANTPWYFNWKKTGGSPGDDRIGLSWKFNAYPK